MAIPEFIERIPLDGSPVRVPFTFSDRIEQDCAVEALILGRDGNELRFVVTDVLDGEQNLARGHTITDFNTIYYGAPWFRQLTQDPDILRGLIHAEATGARLPDWPDKQEFLQIPDGVEPGHFVHIHANIYWGTTGEEGISQTGIWGFEVCKMPADPVVPEDYVRTNQARKIRLAKLVLRGMERKEYIDMQSNERIEPDKPRRPFANQEQCRVTYVSGRTEQDAYVKRFVFGAGPVRDHYVDVTARLAADYHTELGGIQRFTDKGTHLFVPNEMPFGSLDSDDDPLHLVEIRMYSELVRSPALAEQKLYVMIDGVRYEALTDYEQSSHDFSKPGRRLHFGGVRRVGKEKDMYVISPEQSDALLKRRIQQDKIVKAVLNEAIDTHGSLWAANFDELNDEAGRRIMAMRAQATEQNRVIAEILGVQEPQYQNPQGAALLVPRSMLDSIEIEVPMVHGKQRD